MIVLNIQKVADNWFRNDYDLEKINNSYNNLNNVLHSMYENGVITNECLKAERTKLDKLYDEAVSGKEF